MQTDRQAVQIFYVHGKWANRGIKYDLLAGRVPEYRGPEYYSQSALLYYTRALRYLTDHGNGEKHLGVSWNRVREYAQTHDDFQFGIRDAPKIREDMESGLAPIMRKPATFSSR